MPVNPIHRILAGISAKRLKERMGDSQMPSKERLVLTSRDPVILTSQADPKTSEVNAPGVAITKARAVHDWCVVVYREMDSDNISAPCFPLAGLVGRSVRRPQASRHINLEWGLQADRGTNETIRSSTEGSRKLLKSSPINENKCTASFYTISVPAGNYLPHLRD